MDDVKGDKDESADDENSKEKVNDASDYGNKEQVTEVGPSYKILWWGSVSQLLGCTGWFDVAVSRQSRTCVDAMLERYDRWRWVYGESHRKHI